MYILYKMYIIFQQFQMDIEIGYSMSSSLVCSRREYPWLCGPLSGMKVGSFNMTFNEAGAGCLQMIPLLCRTMIPGVFAPTSNRKLSAEAKNEHNSFTWNILRVTSLF